LDGSTTADVQLADREDQAQQAVPGDVHQDRGVQEPGGGGADRHAVDGVCEILFSETTSFSVLSVRERRVSDPPDSSWLQHVLRAHQCGEFDSKFASPNASTWLSCVLRSSGFEVGPDHSDHQFHAAISRPGSRAGWHLR
jgi:hypothetical protein